MYKDGFMEMHGCEADNIEQYKADIRDIKTHIEENQNKWVTSKEQRKIITEDLKQEMGIC